MCTNLYASKLSLKISLILNISFTNNTRVGQLYTKVLAFCERSAVVSHAQGLFYYLTVLGIMNNQTAVNKSQTSKLISGGLYYTITQVYIMFTNVNFMFHCNLQRQVFSIAVNISEFTKGCVLGLCSHKSYGTYCNTQIKIVQS